MRADTPAKVFIKDKSIILGRLDIINSAGDLVKAGWVPVNNDNDNFDGATPEARAKSLTHIYDKDEFGPVTDEDDLVAIKIHPVNGATTDERVRLVFDETKIKIWRDDKKNGVAVGSDFTEFDATKEHVLWVEGRELLNRR